MTSTTVTIGGIPVRFWSRDRSFSRLLRRRYANFLGSSHEDATELTVNLLARQGWRPGAELQVVCRGATWHMQRGDFCAEWNMQSRHGVVRQPRSPYALDSVLRILHTLILAQRGGFLLHAASMIRGSRALVFAGQSGAGKTTMCRLAPPGAVLLTDEISFVQPVGNAYFAFGTPFFGELAVPGKNTFAPLDALYVLEHAAENSVQDLPPRRALTELLKNILLFANDSETVGRVFASAFDLVSRLPVRRLRFAPTARVWDFLEELPCS